MECKNCPYIQDELGINLEEYSRIFQFDEEVVEDIISSCWCEKVNGRIWWYGHCEEGYSGIPKHENHSKKKRRNKRERDLRYKNCLKQLVKNASDKRPSPATYTDEIWVKGHGYVENPKPYYKRLYRGKRSKYLKRQSNKKIRRYKGELHNGWHCHRLYDFWYELD